MLELTLFDWLQCLFASVWGHESVYVRRSEKQNAASEVWLLSTAQQLTWHVFRNTHDKRWHLDDTLIQSDIHKRDDWQKSNIGSCLQDNWPAVTQDADRSKYAIMLDSHLLKLIQIRTKYFAAHVCMSSPRAPTVSRPTLDLRKCSGKKSQQL